MNIHLESSAFAPNQAIPARHAEDGENYSPPLAWDNVPPRTRELAIICDDPDAPTKEPWVHWVIYKIPADARALDEHISIEPRPAAPAGALQGANSWSSGQKIGYRGPAPPPGKVHHYHFRIYALDTALPLESGLTKPELIRAMQGHILAEGQLIGTYKR